MKHEIKDWDPDFDLQNATKEQRIGWRRSFTINWLYDLVNVYSSTVVQCNSSREQCHKSGNSEHSVNDSGEKQRVLFGLSEFAEWITKLAFQNAKTDIRTQILPHHVFQLQCIIDSLMVSRGWSVSITHGHVVKPAPENFRSLRDVDLFLDREIQRRGRGFLHGAKMLSACLAGDTIKNEEYPCSCPLRGGLGVLQKHFDVWLGNSNHILEASESPSSRFSSSSTNGFWEYSPYLCGVGLMEALDISYRFSMLVSDRVPEVMLIIHLHNMLVKKGFIAQPIQLWSSFAELFPDALFRNGKPPTTNFKQAFVAHVGANGSQTGSSLRRRMKRADNDIRETFDLDANRFFKRKSTLIAYRKADWNVERIPDDDVPTGSLLAAFRLTQTKHIEEPDTGAMRQGDTDLGPRARVIGDNEQSVIQKSTRMKENHAHQTAQRLKAQAALASQGYIQSPNEQCTSAAKKLDGVGENEMQRRLLLDCLTGDISYDTAGDLPQSGLSYVWIAALSMLFFQKIEGELEKCRNATWVSAYMTDTKWLSLQRMTFTSMALAAEDTECLRIIAQCLEAHRLTIHDHVYWDHLVDSRGWPETSEGDLKAGSESA